MATHIHIHIGSNDRKTRDAGNIKHMSHQTYKDYALEIYQGEFPLGYYVEIEKNFKKIATTEKFPTIQKALKAAERKVNELDKK